MPKSKRSIQGLTREEQEAWRRAGQRYRTRREKKNAKKKTKRSHKKSASTTSAPKREPRSSRASLPSGHPNHLRVVIFTYERPGRLLHLLRDILAWSGPYRISVGVYDDDSKADYSEPRRLLKAHGWDYVRAKKHYGKRNFWRWIANIHAMQRARPERFFLFLPDDARLCANFFRRLFTLWTKIKDPKKISLSPLVDTGGNRAWTGGRSKKAGSVMLTGCVDLAAICPRRYLEELSFSCPPVSPNRWLTDKSKGSGVGMILSSFFHRAGLSMYSVRQSLVVHCGVTDSRMNPEARAENPLRAVDFVDGEKLHRCLIEEPVPVVVSIASMAYRAEMLRKVIKSLYWQADLINVYLNGYESVPRFLLEPRIRVARSQQHGDRGDAGKFFWAAELDPDCYHLTCDDDLLYPKDYAATMCRAIEQYDRAPLISLHGSVMSRHPSGSYYRERQSLLRCTKAVANDTPVHIPGTGVMAYHTSALQIAPDMFRRPNMADIWVALAAKKQRVPVMVIRHSARWLRHIPDPHPQRSVYARYRDSDRIQSSLVRDAAPWDRPLVPRDNQ